MKKKRLGKNVSDENNCNEESFKGLTIEIRGEGIREVGTIIQVKENKNNVLINFKNRWLESIDLYLYFDEYEELQEFHKVNTLDGEILIRKK